MVAANKELRSEKPTSGSPLGQCSSGEYFIATPLDDGNSRFARNAKSARGLDFVTPLGTELLHVVRCGAAS